MFQGKLPFDDVPVQPQNNKNIPRGYETFVEYVEYLATSPQIDPGFCSDHITQFLITPKVKDEYKKRVLFALSSIDLPDSFWSPLFAQFKTQLSPKWKFAEEFLLCISTAPTSSILQEFNTFNFINQFLDDQNVEIRFSAFSTLYKFRDNIVITDKMVQSILDNLTMKSPKLVFLSVNWIMFLISVDYPRIQEILAPYKDQIFDILPVLGHLINQKQVEFILNFTQPTISQQIAPVTHSSISTACYILSSLPLANDFPSISNIPLNVVLPLYIDIIKNTFSNGLRLELYTAYLKILIQAEAPAQDKIFFETISDMLLQEQGQTEFKLVALYATVARMYSLLPNIMDKASGPGVNPNYFSKLVAVSCIIGIKDNTNHIRDIKKLLTWTRKDASWYVATGAAFLYLFNCNMYTVDSLQELIDISISITDDRVRAMLLIYLSYFAPVNFKSNLVVQMKNLLFPHLFTKYPDVIDFKNIKIHEKLPLLLRVGLTRCIGALAQPDELEDIDEEMKAPLISSFKAGPLTGEELLVDPFFLCTSKDIGYLSNGISDINKLQSFSVSRPYTRVSPTSHALNVEVASQITAKNKSIALDVRLSVQQLTTSLKVYFDIPSNFTPNQISPWVIADLNAGSKINHTITFTSNKMTNPNIGIRVEQDGQEVLNIKLCVPIIDMFYKIDHDDEVAKHIWGKLPCQGNADGLKDGMWVCWNGCVGIKNGIARSDVPAFLKMLPSSSQTVSIIE